MVFKTRFPGQVPNSFTMPEFVHEEGRQLALFKAFCNSADPHALELNAWLATPVGPNGWRHDLRVFLFFSLANLTLISTANTRSSYQTALEAHTDFTYTSRATYFKVY
jgi:hypothetical protein